MIHVSYEPPSGDGWNEPREEGFWLIEGSISDTELETLLQELENGRDDQRLAKLS